MVQDCEYNPERDICQVEQYGYVDLVKANQTSTVDIPLAVDEKQYNDIEDPRSIGERPSDEFELMQANRVVVDYRPPKDESSPSE